MPRTTCRSAPGAGLCPRASPTHALALDDRLAEAYERRSARDTATSRRRPGKVGTGLKLTAVLHLPARAMADEDRPCAQRPSPARVRCARRREGGTVRGALFRVGTLRRSGGMNRRSPRTSPRRCGRRSHRYERRANSCWAVTGAVSRTLSGEAARRWPMPVDHGAGGLGPRTACLGAGTGLVAGRIGAPSTGCSRDQGAHLELAAGRGPGRPFPFGGRATCYGTFAAP